MQKSRGEILKLKPWYAMIFKLICTRVYIGIHRVVAEISKIELNTVTKFYFLPYLYLWVK